MMPFRQSEGLFAVLLKLVLAQLLLVLWEEEEGGGEEEKDSNRKKEREKARKKKHNICNLDWWVKQGLDNSSDDVSDDCDIVDD